MRRAGVLVPVIGVCATLLALTACGGSSGSSASPTSSVASSASESPTPSEFASAPAPSTGTGGISVPTESAPAVAPTPDPSATGKASTKRYPHSGVSATMTGALSGHISALPNAQCRIAHYDNPGNVTSLSVNVRMPDGKVSDLIIGAGSTGASTFVSGSTGIVFYRNHDTWQTSSAGGYGTALIAANSLSGSFQGKVINDQTGAVSFVAGSFRCAA